MRSLLAGIAAVLLPSAALLAIILPAVVLPEIFRPARGSASFSPSSAYETNPADLDVPFKRVPASIIKTPEQAGLEALAAGDLAAAILELERARIDRTITQAGLLGLGEAYWHYGDMSQAVSSWQQAVPSPEVSRRLAPAHRRLGDYISLREELKSLLAAEPADAKANFELGQLYAATEPDSALAYLAQAAHLDEKYAARAQRLQRAITSARLRDEPAFTFMEAGRALAAMDAWDFASEAFRHATQLRPDYAEAWGFYGEALQQQGNAAVGEAELALQSLKRAVALDPESVSAHIFTALYWKRQGRLETATVYLLTADRLDPHNPALQVELANVEVEKGNIPHAQAYYEKAAMLAPQVPDYWRILAEFSLNLQVQPREIALPAAQKVLDLAPEDASSLDLMGYTFYMLSDHLNAERFLLQSIEKDPDYAPAHLHLAMVYLMQDKGALAKEKLEMSVRLAPDSSAAKQAERLLLRYFP